MTDLATNSEKPAKKKPRGKPFQKGVVQNPAGAPKRGKSWAELFNSIGELTGGEVAEKAVALWAKQFKALPKGVTLKELVVIKAYAALLDEGNARLLKEVMDRAEGKVKDQVDVTTDGKELSIRIVRASDARPDNQ